MLLDSLNISTITTGIMLPSSPCYYVEKGLMFTQSRLLGNSSRGKRKLTTRQTSLVGISPSQLTWKL